MSARLPKTGEKIYFLKLDAKGNIHAEEITVKDRARYSLTAEEWSGSDGSRHNIGHLYPNLPAMPNDLFPLTAPWIYARADHRSSAEGLMRNAYRRFLNETARQFIAEASQLLEIEQAV